MLLPLLMNLDMFGGGSATTGRDTNDAPPPKFIQQSKRKEQPHSRVGLREQLEQIFDEVQGISDPRAKKIKKLVKPFRKKEDSAAEIDFAALLEQVKLVQRIIELYQAIVLDRAQRADDEAAIAAILQVGEF